MRKAPTARKQPSQSRSKNTVDAVLDATTRLLLAGENASTNRIAKVAGVSIGSLYQYFPNREALYAAIIDRETRRMESLVLPKLIELFAKPLPEAFGEVVKILFNTEALDPRLHVIMVEHAPGVGKLAHMGEVRDRMATMLRTYLEMHKSEIRGVDIDVAVFILANALESIAVAAKKSYGREVSKVMIEEIAQLVLRYLLPKNKLSS